MISGLEKAIFRNLSEVRLDVIDVLRRIGIGPTFRSLFKYMPLYMCIIFHRPVRGHFDICKKV